MRVTAVTNTYGKQNTSENTEIATGPQERLPTPESVIPEGNPRGTATPSETGTSDQTNAKQPAPDSPATLVMPSRGAPDLSRQQMAGDGSRTISIVPFVS